MKRICLLVLLMFAAPAAAQDMPLSLVLIPGETWKPFTEHSFANPITGLATNRAGHVFVAMKGEKQIVRIDPDGKVTSIPVPHPVHCLTLDAEDHLVVSIPDPGQILRLTGTDKPAILAEGLKGVADLAITREGDVFASLPEENTVVSIRHGQKEKTLTKGLLHPTGVLLWPKEGTLVVGQARGTHMMAFRIDKDSKLVDGDRYYPFRVRPGEVAETTGMTLDRAKRVYAATKEGVQIFDPTGRLCGVIPPPREGKPGGVAFAGEERNLLLLACGDKLYSLKTQANTPPAPKKP